MSKPVNVTMRILYFEKTVEEDTEEHDLPIPPHPYAVCVRLPQASALIFISLKITTTAHSPV